MTDKSKELILKLLEIEMQSSQNCKIAYKDKDKNMHDIFERDEQAARDAINEFIQLV